MFKKLHLFFFLLLAGLSAFSASASADYSITDYYMDVSLLPDGSAEVTEKLFYDFDDEYNGILSLFDTDGIDGIDNFRVFIDGEEMYPVDEMKYEHNTYTVTESGSLCEVRVYSPGSDDVRTVTYEYTMLGLAARYEDAGMILRKFIGENNDVSLRDAIITVRFPGNGEIQAFAHGGMNSENITLYENAAAFGPQTVYSGDSVEVRLLFPAEWIPDAPLQEGSIMKAALAEEQRLLDEAARTALILHRSKYMISAAYLLLFGLIILLMMKKYGVKGRISEANLKHLTAWPAAFAQTAVSGAPDTDGLSGTLMELVSLSRIRMEDEQGDLRFTLLDNRTDDLHPHQAALISWLFASSDTVYLSELNAGSDYERAQAFEKGYNAYLSKVVEDMTAASLRYKNDGLRITINSLSILTGIAAAGFILLAGQSEVLLGCAVVGVMFLFIFLMNKVRTLTNEGELLQNAANLLLSESIASGDALLTYLPYYTALEMTEPLVSEFTHMPDNSPSAPYLYSGWYYGLHRLSSSMRDTHYHNASIPDPNSSSSHGSGGGSNGGGGGHGAW